MASLQGVHLSIGDDIVGPAFALPAAPVSWLPNASGFEDMFTEGGPVGEFLLSAVGEAEKIARGMAPVDTGLLAASLTDQYGTWEGGIWGDVFTEVEYAMYQEVGTVNHAAHPYLRPALHAVVSKYTGLIPPDFEWDESIKRWLS